MMLVGDLFPALGHVDICGADALGLQDRRALPPLRLHLGGGVQWGKVWYGMLWYGTIHYGMVLYNMWTPCQARVQPVTCICMASCTRSGSRMSRISYLGNKILKRKKNNKSLRRNPEVQNRHLRLSMPQASLALLMARTICTFRFSLS